MDSKIQPRTKNTTISIAIAFLVRKGPLGDDGPKCRFSLKTADFRRFTPSSGNSRIGIEILGKEGKNAQKSKDNHKMKNSKDWRVRQTPRCPQNRLSIKLRATSFKFWGSSICWFCTVFRHSGPFFGVLEGGCLGRRLFVFHIRSHENYANHSPTRWDFETTPLHTINSSISRNHENHENRSFEKKTLSKQLPLEV